MTERPDLDAALRAHLRASDALEVPSVGLDAMLGAILARPQHARRGSVGGAPRAARRRPDSDWPSSSPSCSRSSSVPGCSSANSRGYQRRRGRIGASSRPSGTRSRVGSTTRPHRSPMGGPSSSAGMWMTHPARRPSCSTPGPGRSRPRPRWPTRAAAPRPLCSTTVGSSSIGGFGPDLEVSRTAELFESVHGDMEHRRNAVDPAPGSHGHPPARWPGPRRRWSRIGRGADAIRGGLRSPARTPSPRPARWGCPGPATRPPFCTTGVSSWRAARSPAVSTYEVTASAELFDPATGTFAATGPMVTAATIRGAALLHDGRVLVLGGTTPVPGDTDYLRDAELYDPVSGTFTRTGGTAGDDIGAMESVGHHPRRWLRARRRSPRPALRAGERDLRRDRPDAAEPGWCRPHPPRGRSRPRHGGPLLPLQRVQRGGALRVTTRVWQRRHIGVRRSAATHGSVSPKNEFAR